MHAAEHRALRELFAACRHLADHWGALASRLDVPALGQGADDARELLRELSEAAAARGLHGRPAAQGVGSNLARARREVGDRFLERNQALRLALLDVAHAVTLLGYLQALASRRGDEALAELLSRWRARLSDRERRLRDAVRRLADDPDAAIAPLDTSPAGRAAHGISLAVGTAGEWFDRRLGR